MAIPLYSGFVPLCLQLLGLKTVLKKAKEDAGHGRVELVAPFIPTLPGTDTYVDQLR